MRFLRRFGAFALDIFFPIECLGCKKEGHWLCDQCGIRIGIETADVCLICKSLSYAGRTCFQCRKLCALDGLIRFFDYNDILVQQLLQLAKYGYVQDALYALLDTVEPYFSAKLDMLNMDARAFLYVPVPLHPRRLRDRGFNQAEVIAKRLSGLVGADAAPILKRRKDRPPQATLTGDDRTVNIRGNIICQDRAAAGKYIFLIDDVTTTGSTLDECARALQAAGAKEVWGIVLAQG